MSRIGRIPVAIPKGVDVKLSDNNTLTVKGQKGTLTKQFHKDMIIRLKEIKLLFRGLLMKRNTKHCTV